ncbi:MAG: TolC family outer membrane protein, partial [Methylophilaceae bacterium]
MKFFYQIVMVIAAICVNLSVAQADASPNLQEIVEKAVTSNPEVQARYHIFLSAEQEQGVARGALLPRADITSSYRKQENIGPNIGNTNIPERQTQLILRQLLFDGFATSGEVRRLGHAAHVRYYELLSTMQNTALDVVRAYIDLQRYRQLVVYAQDNYVTHKQLFDRIQERVGAGVGRRVDLEQASGRLALAEANLLTETTNLHDVTARYQRLVGELPPDTLQEVNFYKAGVSPTAAEALQLAYRQNPDLLSTIENIVATQQEVKNKQAKYMPRLDIQATKNLSTSSDGTNSIAAADVVQLTLSFNLFNGLADRALINQTAEKLNSTQDLRDKSCVDTRQLVVIAYNDVESLKEQLGYRDQHQLSIEKAREAYRRQFDIGQRTLLDLLDTENEYFQARRTYTVTESDLYIAYARTYAGQGELLNKLGVLRVDLPEIDRPDYMDAQNICQAVTPAMLKTDKLDLVAKAKPLSEILPSLSAQPAAPTSSVPTLQTASGVKSGESDAVTAHVQDWASAWEQKNFEAYINFYADKFVPENEQSREAWLAQRKERLSGPRKIKITLRNIKVNIEGDKASAEFTQLYVAPGYSD